MAGVKHARRYSIFVMVGFVVRRMASITISPRRSTVGYADIITADFVCDVSLPR